jgi:NAD(P)-dependent dehydrogenase (short-subunit alcohol dehydrogenase family)
MGNSKPQDNPIAVVGATGHTGRFVVAELKRRGQSAILIGRDADKLAHAGEEFGTQMVRLARMDDPHSLNSALLGAAAVINCAGPFIDTALPVIDAALRAKIPYLDVTAEQPAVRAVLETRHDAACQAGVALLPAAGFYGGLADLLVMTATDGSNQLDEITVAVALDSWHPTQGTRLTGARNTAKRLVQRNGRLEPIEEPQPHGRWTFPAPFGDQDVVMMSFSETITIANHLSAKTIESWINLAPLRDIRDPATPPPQASDDKGRSGQVFAMDVIVRAGDRHRRATASGHDIYAVTAPIAVEAIQRLLVGEAAGAVGVRSLGEIFEARAFLKSLGPDTLQVSYKDHAEAMLQREVDDARR